ncbi:hypothetical protein ACFVAF_18095 [Streptomyces sp. NPDC057596]|uniref:hypothetical protein n=1 Tax=Streptomyces sp. NPDC057596 TaxID=3346178 RepID=UPI0036822BAF
MALHITGLSPGDLAEVVECLLVGADHCTDHAPELADQRRAIAHRLGDALDQLPAPVIREEPA